MSTTTVSLIVATRYRTTEVKKLLDSLVAQTYQDFDVIIVDQNGDDRLVPVLETYSNTLRVRHVQSNTSGKAAANNVGLRVSQGDVVGFPDDDCWYPPQLLATVTDWFHQHPDFGGLAVASAVICQDIRMGRDQRHDGVPKASVERQRVDQGNARARVRTGRGVQRVGDQSAIRGGDSSR